MDRLTRIIQGQWRVYWRQFTRHRNLNAGNQGIILLIALLAFFKYVQLLNLARVQVLRGNWSLVNSLVAGLFLAWLLVPMSGAAGGISIRSLARLPLSVRDLFVVRTVSMLITPASWIVSAATLAAIYPLAVAPNPVIAIIIVLLVSVMGWLIGMTLSQLLTMAIWRRTLFAALLLAGLAATYLASRARNPTGSIIATLSHQIASAQLLTIASLLLLNVCALVVALWSLNYSLANPPTSGARKCFDSALFRLPGVTGRLAAKDFRYFRTLLDPYFGVFAAAGCCVFLIGSREPSLAVLTIFILVVFFPNASLAFNCFGLDTRAGFDRYALLPATGKQILQGKNLAFIILTGLQVLPIFILTILRLGLTAGAIAILQAGALAAAYLAWGNWMSISLPDKMQPYRFAPSHSSLAETIAGLVFCSLPGLVIGYLVIARVDQTLALSALVAALVGVIYWVSLVRSGERFEKRRETIAATIS